MKITENADKIDNLLFCMGPNTYKKYESGKPNGGTETFDEIVERKKGSFKSKHSKVFHISQFRNVKQHESESIDNFVKRLREHAAECEFANEDGEILNQIIMNAFSVDLKRHILFLDDVNLAKALKLARTIEKVNMELSTTTVYSQVDAVATDYQARGSRSAEMQAERNDQRFKRKFPYPHQSQPQYQNSTFHGAQNTPQFPPHRRERSPYPRSSNSICGMCGGQYPHRDVCPARGKRCDKCNRFNHFQKMCRSKNSATFSSENTNQIEYEQQSYDDCCAVTSDRKRKYAEIKMFGRNVKLLIDTGTTLNILDRPTFESIAPRGFKLTKSVGAAYAYNSSNPLKILGTFSSMIETNSKRKDLEFSVVDGKSGCLFGLEAYQDLGIVKFINMVNTDYEKAFPKLFEDRVGLEAHIYLKKDAIPVNMPLRRTPVHLRDRVEVTLTKMLKNDIIERVTGPTPWVHAMVCTDKNYSDELRIRSDNTQLNPYIIREREITPTVDDIIVDLNGAIRLTKLDVQSAYYHFMLDEESRNYTTFATHLGMFRYRRLNFGLANASEVFQRVIRNILAGVKGCINISDDILIHGKTEEEHNERVWQALKLLEDAGVVF